MLVLALDTATDVATACLTEDGEVVNFHCRAAPGMTVVEVHDHVDEIERTLRGAHPSVKRVISHAEPER